jgi:hypothetical protein
MRVLTLFLLGVLVLVALEPTPCTSIAPVVYAGAAAAARFGGPAVRAVVPKIKQVFHQYSTRKAAKEAAQRASRGNKPVSHGAHKPGYSPHYHQTGKNGKPTDFSIKREPGSTRSHRIHEHFQFPRKQG